MASNRSTQRRQTADSADSPRDALVTLTRRAVRMQIAGYAAAATSFACWAHSVDRLAQAAGDELLRRVDGETDSAELVVRLTRAASAHLRDVSALPRTATDHFDARLARVPTNT